MILILMFLRWLSFLQSSDVFPQIFAYFSEAILVQEGDTVKLQNMY